MEKEKKKKKDWPMASWEEKQQSLPVRCPPVGVLCIATHVPA